MADPTQSYDELAPYYDQIFENWDASITRQATVIAGILDRECGDRRPIRVLDCACGIGTQSLGLAMKGFDVTGCDVSCGVVQRARSEAFKRGLSIPFSVVDMMQLSAIAQSSFDAVICIDNALPHLETKELLQASQQAYGKVRPGGSFIGSIRDYDKLIVERPTSQEPSFYSDGESRRIIFQIWDWMSDAIAFICSSRGVQNQGGRHSISPPPIVQSFEVNSATFSNRQDLPTFDGCPHPRPVFINRFLLRVVTVETRPLHVLTAGQ